MAPMRYVVGLCVALAVIAGASPSGAIIGGEKDGARHPNVAVLEVAVEGGYWLSCSGTLVAPTVVVTAAHCVSTSLGATTSVAVSFDEEPATDANGGLAGPTITGTWAVHPQWQPTGSDLNYDMAVVVLDRPATDLWPAVTPAGLPRLGELDRYAKGPKPQLDAVGYGYHDVAGAGPGAYSYDPVERRTAAVKFHDAGALLTVTNNRGTGSPNSGAICSGDSGGALLAGSTLVGVISFHRNDRLGAWTGPHSQAMDNSASSWCEGWGGYPRLDTASARGFLGQYLTLP